MNPPKFSIHLLPFSVLFLFAHSTIADGIFNVRDHGAIGDGVAMETEAVQSAIDACTLAGGGTVRVPAGEFVIGTIILKSNVTLSLDYGASLLGSTNIADYPTEGLDDPREGGPHCLIYAKDATKIAIAGLGVIDGRGTHVNFPRKRVNGRNTGIRPRLLRMDNCDGLTFSGVTYKRPAFWGIHLIDCRNIHFNAVTVRMRNNNYNNDGLDLDGCENVLIDTTPGVMDSEKSRAGPIMITGIPGHYIEHVVLENIEISYPGYGTTADAKREVPEDVSRYPEQFFFGVLPAWGTYIRHAKNIQFKNVKMTLRGPDERQQIVLSDVEGFVEM